MNLADTSLALGGTVAMEGEERARALCSRPVVNSPPQIPRPPTRQVIFTSECSH